MLLNRRLGFQAQRSSKSTDQAGRVRARGAGRTRGSRVPRSSIAPARARGQRVHIARRTPPATCHAWLQETLLHQSSHKGTNRDGESRRRVWGWRWKTSQKEAKKERIEINSAPRCRKQACAAKEGGCCGCSSGAGSSALLASALLPLVNRRTRPHSQWGGGD